MSAYELFVWVIEGKGSTYFYNDRDESFPITPRNNVRGDIFSLVNYDIDNERNKSLVSPVPDTAESMFVGSSSEPFFLSSRRVFRRSLSIDRAAADRKRFLSVARTKDPYAISSCGIDFRGRPSVALSVSRAYYRGSYRR